MTTYRLFPSTSGPSSPAAYSGNIIAAVAIGTSNTMFLDGYWIWVCPTGQVTTGYKCAMYSITFVAGTTTPAHYTLVSGSTVTSGTLTAGQWNLISLSTPILLAPGIVYIAAIGFINNFPDTNAQWNSGGAYANGITNGPLTAFGNVSNTAWGNFPSSNGMFSTGGNDPSTTAPPYSMNGDNFWVDVQIDDTAPLSWGGSYRLWPTLTGQYADWITQVDNAVNYTLATEIHLASNANVQNIWFFSMPGTAQLPTVTDIWSINSGGLTGTNVYHNASPSWSGAAGAGWIKSPVTGVTLSPGAYKVSVYNGAATPDGWSAKRLNYWGGTGNGNGILVNGITIGALYAPSSTSTPAAALCYSYGVPTPATDGTTTTEQGQNSFKTGYAYPQQYVGTHSPGGNIYQNYWVDMEILLVGLTGSVSMPLGPITLTSTSSTFGTVSGNATLNLGPITLTTNPLPLGQSTINLGPITLSTRVTPALFNLGPLILTATSTSVGGGGTFTRSQVANTVPQLS